MRLFEIRGNGAYTRIEPKTLDIIAQTAAYQRELQQMKPTMPKEKSPVNDKVVRVGTVTISLSAIDEWNETKNTDFIFEISKRWFTQGMTPEMKFDLSRDPEWQAAVIKVWNAASNPTEPIWGHDANNSMWKDIHHTVAFTRKINTLVLQYRSKYGIDKKGLRLPK